MIKTIFGRAAAALSLVLAVAGASTVGCGSSAVASLCDDFCACQGCTSNDRAKCEDDGKSAESQAGGAGCSNEFSDLLTCAKATISCQSHATVVDGCTAQSVALSKCDKTAGGSILPLGDACVVAASHLAECIGTSSGSGSTTTQACTGTALCSAGCINITECPAIKDAFSGMPTAASKPFLDCATKCASAQ